MRKIKAFGYIYYKSLSSIQYYAEILRTDFSFSIKYFLVLGILASIASTANVAMQVVPEISSGIQNILMQAEELYPDDLVFESKDGEWSVNREEPYIVEFPAGVDSWTPEEEAALVGATDESIPFPKNVVVFDHNGEINDMETLDTMILVNDANILVKNTNKIEAYPLGELPAGKLDKEGFVDVLVALGDFARYIPSIVVLFILLGTILGYVVFRAIYLVFVGGVLWILSMFGDNKLDFASAYRVGLGSCCYNTLVLFD
jgi:hypothetical protein